MDTEFYLADTKFNDSYHDMIELTEVTDRGIIYYYRKSYIKGKTIQYEIYDGIWMVSHDLILNKPELYPLEADGILQMNYCIAGRCELHYRNIKVHYVGPGDFIIGLLKNRQYKHSFPLGYYSGDSIITTQEKLEVFLHEVFPDTRIETGSLFAKLEENKEYIAMINHSEIARIVQEMSSMKQVFFKEKSILKCAELMLLLLDDDMEYQISGSFYDSRTVNLVKQIKAEVSLNLDIHRTIEHITEKYRISQKLFTECFKAIYGNTYYAYMKEYRIKKAADLLQKTNDKVTDIAMMVGYQNASKFSQAFADIMGVTPVSYRKK